MVLRFGYLALYNPIIVDNRISVRKANTTTQDAVEDPQDGGGSS